MHSRIVQQRESVDEISLAAVESVTGIGRVEICGNYRKSRIVFARYMFAGAMVELFSLPYDYVAKIIGRDRTTLYHAIQTHSNLKEHDAEYRAKYCEVVRRIQRSLKTA